MAKELTAAELDANSQAELDAEGAGLREAAEKAGGFGPGNMQEEESAPQESEPRAPDKVEVESKAQKEKENADNSDTGAERPRDEQGRFIKKDDASEVLEKVPAEATEGPEASDRTDSSQDSIPKAESDYEKAKKDQERYARNRREFDEEKARERAQIAAEKAQIERERAQLAQRKQQNGERQRDEFGNVIYSSREYRVEASRLRKLALKGEVGPNGEDYAALSEQAEQAAIYSAQREHAQAQQEFEQRQTELAIEVMGKDPELANANSPIAKEIQAVFADELSRSQKHNRNSIFKMIPDGFEVALEVARLRQKAASVSELEAKNKQLETEVKQLREATSIGGSSPTKPSKPRKLEDMSLDEMSKALRERAEAEDSMMSR